MFFFGLAKDFMKDLQQPFGTMPVCAEGCAFRGGGCHCKGRSLICLILLECRNFNMEIILLYMED